MTTLTTENIKAGLNVIAVDHPEWGNWYITRGYTWEVNKAGTRDGKILPEDELHFWQILD